MGVFAYWHGNPRGHYIAVKWNGSQFELYNYYRDETTPVYIDSLDTEMAQTNCTRLCLITFYEKIKKNYWDCLLGVDFRWM